MPVRKLDHIGINFEDLARAKEFFLDLGLVLQGEWQMQGGFLDTIVGLKDAASEVVMVGLPDGSLQIELVKFLRPLDEKGIQIPLANTLGIRHIALVVDDVEAVVGNLRRKGYETFSEIQTYEDIYKTVYCRGPEGIILELAQELK